ncbi:glyoxalase domain-containing protein 5 [Aplysia californica]|uniref:Glyoxalase domain-containing protein 5 n=1 Tax=Aplysia californica TaxID=6500 RepID=A0ABM1A740_APLCA|nr:glyoxalase domain-containing protein 5 [Aplysia californica]
MIRSVVSLALKRHLWKVHCAAANVSSPTVQGLRSASSVRPFQITHLDHLVLTVKDLEATVDFYTRVLGMEATTFKGGRKALNYGEQKINLHESGKEFEPKAAKPTSGSADLCFITKTSLDQVEEHLKACAVDIIEGPVERTGAVGSIRSVYIRDPDGNLVEISNYLHMMDRL